MPAGCGARSNRPPEQQDAFVELSRIVRAKDPADRREQALWRAGQHDHALTNYSERGFVVIEADQRQLEDRALDAAHADRRGGRESLVVVETSNEQLDALNARAQAIRLQDGELGSDSVPLTGRPYGLRANDDIVVRAPVQHPDLGSVRNGVSGQVIDVDAEAGTATLRLSDGREAAFDRGLLDTGQVRLAYVSHPFPAQGRTTDTTHVIAGPLSTAEGSYVALTRAREHTHLYASSDQLELPESAGARRSRVGGATRPLRARPAIDPCAARARTTRASASRSNSHFRSTTNSTSSANTSSSHCRSTSTRRGRASRGCVSSATGCRRPSTAIRETRLTGLNCSSVTSSASERVLTPGAGRRTARVASLPRSARSPGAASKRPSSASEIDTQRAPSRTTRARRAQRGSEARRDPERARTARSGGRPSTPTRASSYAKPSKHSRTRCEREADRAIDHPRRTPHARPRRTPGTRPAG